MRPNEESDQRPILCGTDFSPTALEAANIAAGLAERLKTKLIVVHVSAFRALGTIDPPAFHDVMEKERDQLKQEEARLRSAKIDVESQFRSGSPFDELVTAATEAGAQLIVVGAVGHGLARRLLLGSVAERTAEISPVPTLVIRPGGRLSSWIRGEHPLKVLLGYDFSAAGDAALHWLSRFRQVGACDIHIVHLDRPMEVAAQTGYKGPLPLTENPREIQEPLQRQLEDRVHAIFPPGSAMMTVQPAWGSLEGCMFQISHELESDLVVLGTHQRTVFGRLRFGSVSRSVLHHARVSVAVIPPPDSPGKEET